MGISWLLFLMIPFVLIVSTIPANALSYDIQLNNTKNNIIILDDKITNQNILVSENRDFLHHKNDILQQYQKDSLLSWDALLSIEEAEIKRDAAANSFTESRKDLRLLLSERSTQYKLIKRIKLDVINNYTKSESTTGLTKLIGIDLSKSCEISTKCLNYEDLIYLDSSDTNNSGEFIQINGDIRRDKSPREESWRFYDYEDKLRVIVDPPNGMAERIKMITLTNNLDVYFNIEDMKMENQTRTWQENRYVDNCKNATISVKDWQFLLVDTIDYLRTGCTITDFNSTRYEIMTPTNYDPRDSPNWLFTQWQNDAKIKCKGLCFEY